jgi:hypothetical protein
MGTLPRVILRRFHLVALMPLAWSACGPTGVRRSAVEQAPAEDSAAASSPVTRVPDAGTSTAVVVAVDASSPIDLSIDSSIIATQPDAASADRAPSTAMDAVADSPPPPRDQAAAPSPADAGAPPTTLRSGLVGYWSFDEGTGTTASDGSGNGNHGTLKGMGGAAWVPGHKGKALSFDGAGWINTTTTASLNTVTQALTVAAWVFVSAGANAGYRVLLQRQVGTTTAEYYGMGLYNDNPYLSGNTIGDSILYEPLPTGRWVHLAATYDGKARHIYVDGVLKHDGVNASRSIATDGTPLTIGAGLATSSPDVGSRWFQGLMDELVLYSRALSSTEVAALASGQLP